MPEGGAKRPKRPPPVVGSEAEQPQAQEQAQPKKKARGSGGGTRNSGASRAAAAGSATSDGDTVNSAYMAGLAADLQVVMSHPLFSDIKELQPVRPDAEDEDMRATRLPIDPTQLVGCVNRLGTYEGGCNLFWLDWLYTPTPGVPSSLARTRSTMQDVFATPTEIPTKVVVSVPKAINEAELTSMTTASKLKRLSPEEPLVAFVGAIARGVKNAASTETMKQWKRLALSTLVEFRAVDSADDVHWAAVNMREDVVRNFVTMRTTTLWRLYEVYQFKERKDATCGKLGAAKIAHLYKLNMRRAETSEEVTDSFVDNALTVHERLLSTPQARKVLQEAEEQCRYGRNPFEHLFKLLAIVTKAGSRENIS